MIRVKVSADSRYPVNRKRLRRLVEEKIRREGITSDVEVSLAVVGDRKMKDLNRKYHGVEGTTDVLSFPYLDDASSQDVVAFVTPNEAGMMLGDVVISYPQAVKQAQEKGLLVDEEVDFLVDHGMEHLLGRHHG